MWEVFDALVDIYTHLVPLGRRESLVAYRSLQSSHPLRLKLRGPMAPVLQRVLAGEDQFAAEQVEFAIEVSKLRFIPTCEYQAEGQHAKTHKRGLGRHNHTEQYQSYGLRLPELARALDSRPEVMHELAYCCQVTYNAQMACQAVGLSGHPSVTQQTHEAAATQRKSRLLVHAKVIYHADSHTLYRAVPPDLEYRPDDDGDDQPAAPHDSDGKGHVGHSEPSASTSGVGSSGGDGGDGNPSKPARRVLVNHQGALDLLKKYLLQFVLVMLKDQQAMYLAVPVVSSALVKLSSALRGQARRSSLASDEDPGLALAHVQAESGNVSGVDLGDLLQAKKFQALFQDMLFFKVVRLKPSMVTRRRGKGERGFEKNDSVVAAHKVLRIAVDEQLVIVDAASHNYASDIARQSLVLSFEALPLEALLDLRLWEPTGEMEYSIDASILKQPVSFSGECRSAANAVIQQFLEGTGEDGAALSEQFMQASPWHREILQSLNHSGIIEKTGNVADQMNAELWKFTRVGRRSVQVGLRLRGPERALKVREGVAVQEYTIWELMMHLDMHGWRHVLKMPLSKEPDLPFLLAAEGTCEAGPKIWYTKPRANAICHAYLVLLAKGTQEVQHWKSGGFYAAQLHGAAFKPRSQRACKFKSQAEDDWDAGEAMHEATRARKNFMPSPVAGLDGVDGSSSDGMDGLDDGVDGSSSGSSSSSSSGSSSSSSSSTGDTELPPNGRGPNRTDVGLACGLNHMVKVFSKTGAHSGWEMLCNHPLHQGEKRCRKNLRNTAHGRTEPLTRMMLQEWAFRGRDKDSCKEHMDLWATVESEGYGGEITEPISMVTEFAHASGEAVAAPRKRKRGWEGHACE